MKPSALSAFVVALPLAVILTSFVTTSEAAGQKITYKDVKPLLDKQCVKCHNSKRAAEGVDLSSYKAIKAGSHGKPLFVAGKPAESRIVTYCDGTKEPRMPMRAAPLSDKEISLLKAWVKGGAKK